MSPDNSGLALIPGAALTSFPAVMGVTFRLRKESAGAGGAGYAPARAFRARCCRRAVPRSRRVRRIPRPGTRSGADLPAFDRGAAIRILRRSPWVPTISSRCTRLNVHGKYPIGSLPATPARQRSAHGRSHMPSAANNGTTRRRSTSSPRMASSGERSNPLIGGSNRRAGRSTGSVSECSRLTAGL